MQSGKTECNRQIALAKVTLGRRVYCLMVLMGGKFVGVVRSNNPTA